MPYDASCPGCPSPSRWTPGYRFSATLFRIHKNALIDGSRENRRSFLCIDLETNIDPYYELIDNNERSVHDTSWDVNAWHLAVHLFSYSRFSSPQQQSRKGAPTHRPLMKGMEMLRRSSVFAAEVMEVFDRSPTDKELVSQSKMLCRDYIHSRLNKAGIGWTKSELGSTGGTLGEVSTVLLWLGKTSRFTLEKVLKIPYFCCVWY